MRRLRVLTECGGAPPHATLEQVAERQESLFVAPEVVVLADVGAYPLCWCRGTCAEPADFTVDAGLLFVEGVYPGQTFCGMGCIPSIRVCDGRERCMRDAEKAG